MKVKVYDKYKKRQQNKMINQVVIDNCRAYIEHMDLIMLDVLHTEFGFGAKRLERVYRMLDTRFDEYLRFMASDDHTFFNDGVERDDTYALKYKLREIGFDYNEIVKELTEGKKNDE